MHSRSIQLPERAYLLFSGFFVANHMFSFFHLILYRPLFNLLVGIYNTLPNHDLALAIILLTILVKVVLSPLSIKMMKSQKSISAIQPKLRELQDKHKDDKSAFAQASMALYKEHNVSPLGGCLPLLIQLPIIWMLYRVFINGLKPGSLAELYSFVHNPGTINAVGFGFLDLSHANPVLAILAGLGQGIQSWLSLKLQKTQTTQEQDNPALKMSKQMLYFFPVMITFIAWSLPAGLALYWVTSTLWSIFEQVYIRRRYQ